MHKQWITSFVLVVLGLPMVAQPTAAQPKQQEVPPTLVMRVQSFEALIGNFKMLAKLAGKEEIGNQVEALIKAQAGPKGLDGIDTARPIGIYARLGEELSSISGVLMIPIKNEQAFLTLLANTNHAAERNKDGLYLINQTYVPADIGFRFSNGYAYVTGLNLDAIAPGNLLHPRKAFPPNIKALASGAIHMDQIPKAAKDIAIQKIEEQLIKLKRKARQEGDTEAQKEFLELVVDTLGMQIADFLRGATEVAGRFDIDSKTKQVTFEMTVDGNKDSQLMATIAALGKHPNLFAGLHKKNAAANQTVYLAAPKELSRSFSAVIDEAIQKGLAKEPNAKKRAFARKFVEAFLPTIRYGVLHSASSLQFHDNGRLTVVGGTMIKNGTKLEQVLKDLHKELPPREQNLIKLDVAKVGNATIHEVNVQDKFGPKEQKLFGNNPVYVAVRSDAIFIALGENSLDAVKQAVTTKASGASPVLHYDIDIGRILMVAAETPRQQAIAKRIFSKNPGIVRVHLEGGKKLQLHVSVSLSVIEFGIAVRSRLDEVRLEASPSRLALQTER